MKLKKAKKKVVKPKKITKASKKKVSTASTKKKGVKKTLTKKTATKKAAKKSSAKKAATKKTVGKKPVARKTATKTTEKKVVRKRSVKTVKETLSRSKKGKMRKKDLKEFKSILISQRDRILEEVNLLKKAALQPSDSVISEDNGTDVFERQFALNLASSEHQSIAAIDEALRHIEDGSYGVCDECGGLIQGPRLKALPFARLCIECKSALEEGKQRGSV